MFLSIAEKQPPKEYDQSTAAAQFHIKPFIFSSLTAELGSQQRRNAVPRRSHSDTLNFSGWAKRKESKGIQTLLETIESCEK
jgi:hypothetical protein